jgi:hypothetical protein
MARRVQVGSCQISLPDLSCFGEIMILPAFGHERCKIDDTGLITLHLSYAHQAFDTTRHYLGSLSYERHSIMTSIDGNEQKRELALRISSIICRQTPIIASHLRLQSPRLNGTIH